MSMNKIYLDISYQKKDRAKLLGAKWDAQKKSWYSSADNLNLEKLQAIAAELPPQVVGYEKPTRLILPELVPSTCWYSNLRSELTTETWDAFKRHFGKRSNYKCELTGTSGPKHPVELHEHWAYDDEKQIQKLVGLSMLAPAIHLCMHPGFASTQGRMHEVIKTMTFWNSKIVENYNEDHADKDVHDAFLVWQERSKHNWALDISYLEEIGVPYTFKAK